MNDRFLKPYSPTEVETSIYKKWEEGGFFNPDICIEKGITTPDAPHFSIVLPPPNVTGVLHLGHVLMTTIQDIYVRKNRMAGLRTLWLPGTDHAAIATQSVVEKNLSKQGVRRHDVGREEFLKKVETYAEESKNTILGQLKAVGASLDWSRLAYTLDEQRNLAVRTAFKKMYDDGLIYRGFRIINWDPKGQTTISDDEIVYQEEKTKFYYFKYGPFVIATARPETKFGDKYVVMHPDDERYADYHHGQKLNLEWINGPITTTVIKDSSIDMAFGTGVMTITPWHSVTDFEIAERHGLDKEQIIDSYGKLLPIAGEFAGMKITDARPKIVEKLREKGLIEKEEDYTHNVATAERTSGIIEPQIMNQWFVDVNKPIKDRDEKTLKELMLEAPVEFVPPRFEHIYRQWILNLRDWCISRQIWFGHQIPVWYRDEEIFVGIEAPTGSGWTQDTDTLDTWFSSGLWTFSTLGWPEKSKDLENYHPTTLLETGNDIIFFWVARMILMSTYILGEIPFKTAYFHGLVRNEKGQKISKSLGNNIEPLEMIKKYGADALRMSMIIGTQPGNESRISEEKIRAYQKFANKIWNITRFVLQTEPVERNSDKDKEYLEEVQNLKIEITKDIDGFRLHLAGEKLYHYVWHQFADVIIEEAKKENVSHSTLVIILETILKLLHPFMPYITEEIWGLIGKKNLLIIEKW